MSRHRLFAAVSVFAIVFAAAELRAQRPHGEEGMGKPRAERLERFRKMRLVEVLKLNEEDAVRFFSKQSAHEDIQRDLMKERNAALDDIEESVRKAENDKELPTYSDRVRAADEKIFKERQRYQEDVKKMVTSQQFAKFLLFERNFNRQVRDALQDMRDDRGKKVH